LASSWPSTLRRDALMIVLLDEFARSGADKGGCLWRGSDIREGQLFLKILFKNADITKRNLRQQSGHPPL
ncbi:MAG TPA: hypothetical protein VN798_20710, partial [Pseudomonas sp.]|nr:hypothetical protein [Pseudomonas sp.]